MNESLPASTQTQALLSTNALKIWAIIAMVCDHFPYMLQPWQEAYYSFPWFLLHAFGRITAPVFFYLLALGYRRTRNANRYTVRLLIFALLSYVPYIWYFHNAPPDAQNFHNLNVIFTMLFGLLLLRALHEIRNTALKAVCVVLCLLGGWWCDYGLYGLAVILICDIARGSRRGTVLGMGAAMMVFVYANISSVFPDSAGPFGYLAGFSQNPRILAYLIVLLCQLLPLILIARHRVWFPGLAAEPRPGALAKWGFYIFYPAHITALLLIRLLLLA
ncbi:MAG: conjugal transfer protein TraX [Clostridiales bacterium]|nr:conjugal transfer protein TraX [Clostridiales bacterium]